MNGGNSLDHRESKYTISHDGLELAPLAMPEIADGLKLGSIAPTDFVWDESSSDWVSLLEFAPFKTYMQSLKPKSKPSSVSVTGTNPLISTAPTETPSGLNGVQTASTPTQQVVAVSQPMKWPLEWTVRSVGGQMFGPFSVWGIIKALQAKSIFEFDSVKREADSKWTPIAMHETFNAAAIAEWQKKVVSGQYPELQDEVFFQRKHPRLRLADLFRLERAPDQAKPTALVHDNENVFEAEWIEASQGGTGLIVQSPHFRPGQRVHLHFASLLDLPAFNAIGEIVSLHQPSVDPKQSLARSRRRAMKLGLRYLKIDPSAECDVRNYLELKAKSLKSIA